MSSPTVKVLVIDDEQVVCGGIARILERQAYSVEFALSGEQGLRKAAAERYDVILVDLMMPQLDGIEVLLRLREQLPLSRIVMITGYATHSSAVQALVQGAFDYLPKPFSADELLSVMARAAAGPALHAAALPVPAGRYLLGMCSWVLLDSNRVARIGVQDLFQRTAGEMISLDLPFEGDELEQGEVCCRAAAVGRKVHAIWSPLSGQVVETQLALHQDPGLVNRDPYGEGWLLRLLPTRLSEELGRLRQARGE
jgi:CheY-like chemotaxis protein/glycine cleavage system H lipoate-binding protein